jgi:hypothetical protein
MDLQVASTPQAQPVAVKDRRNWRVVRVFVSSTFADMFAEREILVRQVFPKLRAWADERRLRIIVREVALPKQCQQFDLKVFQQECDLRWGVVKDSDPETVFRTCLGELDRCIEADTNPFFINLLGHRYG